MAGFGGKLDLLIPGSSLMPKHSEGKSVEKIATANMWLGGSDIHFALNDFIDKKRGEFFVTPPTSLEALDKSYVETNALRLNSGQSLLIPMLVNANHWLLVSLKKSGDTGYELEIWDSRAKDAIYQPDVLQAKIQQKIDGCLPREKIAKIQFNGAGFQQDSISCGYFVVAEVLRRVAGGDDPIVQKLAAFSDMSFDKILRSVTPKELKTPASEDFKRVHVIEDQRQFELYEENAKDFLCSYFYFKNGVSGDNGEPLNRLYYLFQGTNDKPQLVRVSDGKALGLTMPALTSDAKKALSEITSSSSADSISQILQSSLPSPTVSSLSPTENQIIKERIKQRIWRKQFGNQNKQATYALRFSTIEKIIKTVTDWRAMEEDKSNVEPASNEEVEKLLMAATSLSNNLSGPPPASSANHKAQDPPLPPRIAKNPVGSVKPFRSSLTTISEEPESSLLSETSPSTVANDAADKITIDLRIATLRNCISLLSLSKYEDSDLFLVQYADNMSLADINAAANKLLKNNAASRPILIKSGSRFYVYGCPASDKTEKIYLVSTETVFTSAEFDTEFAKIKEARADKELPVLVKDGEGKYKVYGCDETGNWRDVNLEKTNADRVIFPKSGPQLRELTDIRSGMNHVYAEMQRKNAHVPPINLWKLTALTRGDCGLHDFPELGAEAKLLSKTKVPLELFAEIAKLKAHYLVINDFSKDDTPQIIMDWMRDGWWLLKLNGKLLQEYDAELDNLCADHTGQNGLAKIIKIKQLFSQMQGGNADALVTNILKFAHQGGFLHSGYDAVFTQCGVKFCFTNIHYSEGLFTVGNGRSRYVEQSAIYGLSVLDSDGGGQNNISFLEPIVIEAVWDLNNSDLMSSAYELKINCPETVRSLLKENHIELHLEATEAKENSPELTAFLQLALQKVLFNDHYLKNFTTKEQQTALCRKYSTDQEKALLYVLAKHFKLLDFAVTLRASDEAEIKQGLLAWLDSADISKSSLAKNEFNFYPKLFAVLNDFSFDDLPYRLAKAYGQALIFENKKMSEYLSANQSSAITTGLNKWLQKLDNPPSDSPRDDTLDAKLFDILPNFKSEFPLLDLSKRLKQAAEVKSEKFLQWVFKDEGEIKSSIGFIPFRKERFEVIRAPRWEILKQLPSKEFVELYTTVSSFVANNAELKAVFERNLKATYQTKSKEVETTEKVEILQIAAKRAAETIKTIKTQAIKKREQQNSNVLTELGEALRGNSARVINANTAAVIGQTQAKITNEKAAQTLSSDVFKDSTNNKNQVNLERHTENVTLKIQATSDASYKAKALLFGLATCINDYPDKNSFSLELKGKTASNKNLVMVFIQACASYGVKAELGVEASKNFSNDKEVMQLLKLCNGGELELALSVSDSSLVGVHEVLKEIRMAHDDAAITDTLLNAKQTGEDEHTISRRINASQTDRKDLMRRCISEIHKLANDKSQEDHKEALDMELYKLAYLLAAGQEKHPPSNWLTQGSAAIIEQIVAAGDEDNINIKAQGAKNILNRIEELKTTDTVVERIFGKESVLGKKLHEIADYDLSATTSPRAKD